MRRITDSQLRERQREIERELQSIGYELGLNKNDKEKLEIRKRKLHDERSDITTKLRKRKVE